jgi:hypothetical protein
MQNGSQLDQENHRKNDPQKGTRTMGNENRGLFGHTPGYMAYCEVSRKEGRTKDTSSYSWSFRFSILTDRRANTIADCLEIQFTSQDLCDENRKRRV